MDTAHDRPPLDEAADNARETELRLLMEQSERDVAASRMVPLPDVLAELDQLTEVMEARRTPGA